MNGTIQRVLFPELEQPDAYEVLTGIFRFGPSRSAELLDLAERSGGITESGVRIVARCISGMLRWTITKEN